MPRHGRRTALIVVAGVLILGGVFVWALPEIVRRVALDQIPKRTGRAVAIEDVDVNPFTGHLAVKGFRLAEREGPAPFVEFERFDVRLGLMDLLRSHVRVRDLALVAPSLRVVRRGPVEFNFSDLLAGTKEAAPEPRASPSRWTVTLEHVRVLGGRARIDDRAVSPPAEWRVQGLDIEATNLTTRAGAAPGELSLRAQIDEARLGIRLEPVRLAPLRAAARLSLDGFQTRRLEPYVYIPLGTPYRPKGGRFGLALDIDVDSDAEEVQKATLSGTLSLEGEAFSRIGRPDPFVSASRLGVEIREADAIARTLILASVAIEGLDLAARRDARGVIDLLEMFTPKAPPPSATARGAPPPPSAPPGTPPAQPARRTLFPIIQALGRGFEQIRVERIMLAPSTATFVDDTTKPTTRLRLTKLHAQLDDLTWPVKGPATLTLSTGLPGGGTLHAKGPVTVQPFDAELTLAIRNAPVEPYQAYIPVAARLSGRFNGDSRNRLAFRGGTFLATSKGNSWAENVEIREPGVQRPAIRVARMELVGIDFDWPRHAAVVKALFRRPRVEIDRGVDGAFNLRRLFTAPGPEGAAPAPEPKTAGPPAGPEPKGILETMRLEFREVRIEDGFIRFLDRTTTPAFSQDLSRLDVALTDFGNRPDRRARLVLQSVVGGDAGLDIRGEISALGAPTLVDLVGELRSFKLPSVDPYASAATGWVIKTGELQYKVRFKLDGNELAADNDVVVGQLQVAPASASDEVKRRIGLPLGLIVALIKDQKGDIRVNVPVTGTVNDPKFALGDAIWTAIKNVLVNIVAAPFKAIGRLFSGGEKVEEPKVDPVTFAAGSAVLSPAMEDHLLRVADFLRRSPFVDLALSSAPSRGDVDALRSETVAARLREFQRERGLEDAAAVLAAYYKERLPDVPLPATVDEQMALLREREPVPEAQLTDLGRRRLQATRERLLTAEGIPEARLTVEATPPAVSPGPAPSPDAADEGRVEFAIVAGE
jgi:hypothetical protein